MTKLLSELDALAQNLKELRAELQSLTVKHSELGPVGYISWHLLEPHFGKALLLWRQGWDAPRLIAFGRGSIVSADGLYWRYADEEGLERLFR